MGKRIKQKEASDFWDTIDDPIVQAVIQHAHNLMFVGDVVEFEGEFDLLYFYQLLEALLRDRHRLAAVLKGEVEEHPWAAD